MAGPQATALFEAIRDGSCVIVPPVRIDGMNSGKTTNVNSGRLGKPQI